MQNKNVWLIAGAAALSMTMLQGCTDEEVTCDIDADCEVEGEICGADNICRASCTIDDHCRNNEVCTDGACVPEEAECTVATQDVDCATGEVCNANGLCVTPDAPVYVYVAVVSTLSVAADIETTTPGPDLDAIELNQGGSSVYASGVEAYAQGEEDPTEGNNYTDPNEALGMNDAIVDTTGDEDCNLDGDAGDPRFWAMGGGATSLGEIGFGVFSFGTGTELADGDVITVWELSSVECLNVGVERSDSYEVYVGLDTADVTNYVDVDDFFADSANWISLAASQNLGGVSDFTVALPQD